MRRVSMVLVAVLLVGGCGTSPERGQPSVGGDVGGSGGVSAANTSSAGGRRVAADVEFVRALIPHHQQGIALAREVAKRPEARVLAEAVIVTQQDEVVRMTGWLKDWGESAPPSAKASPAPGDAVRALIAHQEEAIKLAQREQANGANPTALAFARQVIESRAGEVDQLRTYLAGSS
jgi:uncharacterized protein (DUF305 family)